MVTSTDAVDKAQRTFMTKSPEDVRNRRTLSQNNEGFIYNKVIIFY